MRSAPGATANRIGNQHPRIETLPAGGRSHPDVDAAVELVTAAGLSLDPWQEHVLRMSLLQRNDDRWAAFQVGLVCPRQNGKNAIIEARELAGMFILGEQLIIHSAHLADTAKEAFRRLDQLIDANEWLSREVKHVWRTNGHEALELKSGARIKFKTRTVGGGRGLSGDLVVFDEAMIFPEASHAAVLPVLSARRNPQAWYTGSSVDQRIHDAGRVLTSIREAALAGANESLAYFEWSVDADKPHSVTPEQASDPELWADANPSFGIRIRHEYIEKEQAAFGFDTRSFAVERLGVGDWPSLDGESSVIPTAVWNDLADRDSRMLDPVCFAFDVTPDRSWASIAAAGHRQDGHQHVEVVEHRRGTGWIAARAAELTEKHQHVAFVCDGAGPAGSLLHELDAAGVETLPVTAKEHAQACGMLFDAVQQGTVHHLNQPELLSAIRGAATRPLAEAWAWSRKGSSVAISPLVAATLANWGSVTIKPKSDALMPPVFV